MTPASLSEKTRTRLETWAPLATCCLILLPPTLRLLVQADIGDSDVWWHLRSARWIVEHRALPALDCFSDYGQGKPWVDYSWLAQLLLYGLCQVFGLFGLRVFVATMAAAILGALYALLGRLQPNYRLTAIMTLVAALGCLGSFTPRPWLFSILFFIIELDLLLTASRSGKGRLLLWLVPLFAIWANVHIQCMVGLFLLGLAAIEPLAARLLPEDCVSPDARRLPLGWLLGTFVLSALALLVNPYHFRLYQTALELMGQSGLWNMVFELLAMPFRTWSNWAVLAVAVGAAFAMGRARQVRPLLVLALAASVYFGFRSQRDAWMVLITGLAAMACCAAPPGFLRSTTAGRQDRRAALVVLASLAVGIACFHRQPLEEQIAREYPVRAAEFVARQGLSGPMYNAFHWGGYLMYALPQIPVGIDGRSAVHGEQRLLRNWSNVFGKDGWQSDPELARARLVILPNSCPLSSLLLDDGRFHRVYCDEVATVFQRDEAPRRVGKTAASFPYRTSLAN
jgi:hypothetical protein